MEIKTCAVDKHPLKREITLMLAAGKGAVAVEREMKDAGHPIKRETVTNHVKVCLGGDVTHAAEIEKIVAKAEAGAPRAQVERDFAAAVQRHALEELGKGHLRVTTKDGLVAQQLIDKRAEKAQDRAFVMDLARLLSGAGAPPPEEYIDGEFTDLGEGNLLAPPELRDGE